MARRINLILLGVLTLSFGGCKEEEPIRKYQAARVTEKDAPDPNKTRLLAALIAREDVTWSFKLLGPRQDVDAHAEAFERFLQSVQFKKEAKVPITWIVPQGWRAQGGTGLGRYATFQLGTQERPLELRVNRLPGGGTLLANVNRWREQDLGLPEISEEELANDKSVRRLEVQGVPVTVVDLTGPGNRRAAMGL